jgi:hypothetical protein
MEEYELKRDDLIVDVYGVEEGNYITSFSSEWTDKMIYIALQKMESWYRRGIDTGRYQKEQEIKKVLNF